MQFSHRGRSDNSKNLTIFLTGLVGFDSASRSHYMAAFLPQLAQTLERLPSYHETSMSSGEVQGISTHEEWNPNMYTDIKHVMSESQDHNATEKECSEPLACEKSPEKVSAIMRRLLFMLQLTLV